MNNKRFEGAVQRRVRNEMIKTRMVVPATADNAIDVGKHEGITTPNKCGLNRDTSFTGGDLAHARKIRHMRAGKSNVERITRSSRFSLGRTASFVDCCESEIHGMSPGWDIEFKI